ncbi:MAG: serine/threonine-protein kinase, partial [Myxococcota bacterium]
MTSAAPAQTLSSATDPIHPRDSENLAGRHLGPWRIVAQLGAGGMGTVYYAEHGVIGRRAAIKVLNSAVSAIPDVVERFFDEARTVNDIRHPNIVDITDFGVLEGQYYLVMELLEGETLAERIEEKGPMALETARSLAGQVALALHAAHERGVIHRDLKPENIFLTNHADYPDRVKVLDFGIAKLLGDGGEASRKTQTGVIMGTPAYMSPEQCVGDDHLDRRSDVYSLGIVAFEMFAGRTPFEADNFGRFVLAHVHEEPPRLDSLVEVPGAVADVLAKALEKNAGDRFQSAEEFRLALDAAAQGRSQAEVRQSERDEKHE